MSDSCMQLNTPLHAYVWSDQAGENIHNDDKREPLKKKKKNWERFKCFRNGRNCSFNENYDGAVAVDGSERDGSVDRWFGSKRSKNLENVAEREKSRWDLKKGRMTKEGRVREDARCDNFTKKIYFFFSVQFRCNAELRLLKFYWITLLSFSIKLQIWWDNWMDNWSPT